MLVAVHFTIVAETTSGPIALDCPELEGNAPPLQWHTKVVEGTHQLQQGLNRKRTKVLKQVENCYQALSSSSQEETGSCLFTQIPCGCTHP